MKKAIERSRPRIAIVGAGLAGLSAAYYLRKKADVTIFEASERTGGRILTSRRLRGEHGAEFLLTSEGTICRLLKALKVKRSPVISDWPGYLFRGHFTCGKPGKPQLKQVLSSSSDDRVMRLFDLVKRGSWRKKQQPADRWLSSFLCHDRQAIQFVSMLLAGETCAPLSHLRTEYVLECLWSFLDDDEWYRVHGGSKKIVDALVEQSRARVRVDAQVNGVSPMRGRVLVRWTQNDNDKSEIFDAVIVVTPKGERLVGEPLCRHFHGYLNILLEFTKQPRLKADPDFDLARGLYIDSSLNYLELTRRSPGSYVLRILIPNAEKQLRWADRRIISLCTRQLRQILINADTMSTWSVKRWRFGLPCGGSKELFRKVSNHIYLAGDRFGKWPSMNSAIVSGLSAAGALQFVTRGGGRNGGQTVS